MMPSRAALLLVLGALLIAGLPRVASSSTFCEVRGSLHDSAEPHAHYTLPGPVSVSLGITNPQGKSVTFTSTSSGAGTTARYSLAVPVGENGAEAGDTVTVEIQHSGHEAHARRTLANPCATGVNMPPVRWRNDSPQVDVRIMPAAPLVGDSLFAASTASDPNGDDVGTAWVWEVRRAGASGFVRPADIARSAGVVPASHVRQGDAWRLLVTATDDHGALHLSSAEVLVARADDLPIPNFAVDPTGKIPAGRAVTFDARQSRDGPAAPVTPASSLEFRWDFEGGGAFDTAFQPSFSVVQFVYPGAGTFRPTLEVRDAQGFAATTYRTLLANAVPTAQARIVGGIRSGIDVAGEGIVSDADNDDGEAGNDDDAVTRDYVWSRRPSCALAGDAVRLRSVLGTASASDILPGSLVPPRGQCLVLEVVPHDGIDEGGVSAAARPVNVAPAPPTQLHPANRSQDVPRANVALRWGSSTDADGDPVTYDVLLGPKGSTRTLVAGGLASTELVTSLAGNREYDWQVVARDGLDASEGAVWWFRTDFIPPSVTPLSPGLIASTEATLRGRLESVGSAAAVEVILEYAPSGSTLAPVSLGSRGPGEFEAVLTGLQPGRTYQYRFRAVGDAESSTPVATFGTPDSLPPTAPSFTGNAQPGGWTNAARLAGTLSSIDDGGVAGYRVRLDAGTEPLGPLSLSGAPIDLPLPLGTSYLHAFAIDTSGNQGPRSRIGPFHVERVPPTASFASTTHEADAYSRLANGRVSWTSDDAQSGFAAAGVTVDGLARPATSPIELANLAQGAHEIRLVATDHAGNMAQAAYRFHVDLTGPTVTLTGPSFVSAQGGAVQASAQDAGGSGVDDVRIEYRRNQEPWNLLAGGATGFPVPATRVHGDRFEFRAFASDRAGNPSSPSASPLVVRVDTAPPTAPTDVRVRPLDQGNFRIAWSPGADADSSVTAYRVYGGPVGAAPRLLGPSTSASFDANVAGASGSRFQFAVAAVDAAGNEGAVGAPVGGTSRLQALPPPTGVRVEEAAQNGFHATRALSLAWDASPEAESYEVWADGATVAATAGTIHQLVLARDGPTRVEVASVDGFGHRAASTPLELRIDTTAPVSRVTAPAATASDAVEVTFDAQDAGAGVRSVSVFASRDEGPFSRVHQEARASGAFRWSVEAGSSYAFVAVAVDGLGHEERKSLDAHAPDATVRVGLAATAPRESAQLVIQAGPGGEARLPPQPERVRVEVRQGLVRAIHLALEARAEEAVLRVEDIVSAEPDPSLIAENANILQLVDVTLATPNPRLRGAWFEFEVGAERLRDAGVGPEGIALFRLEDDAWARLPTHVLASNETTHRFEAYSPGFSRFAIVAIPSGSAVAPASVGWATTGWVLLAVGAAGLVSVAGVAAARRIRGKAPQAATPAEASEENAT